jgi:phosphatidylglycerophosphate synthase
MSDYKLTDRRPIMKIWRKLGYGPVDLFVKWGVHPDSISYASVVFALLGGAGLYFAGRLDWLLLVAPCCFLLRLYCNMVDGMVAVKANKCSARGEVINELPDRISDTVIFVGLGLSGLADRQLVYWVIIGMLFGTYVGVLGKAVGARREFGGVMSKQWRMFVLAAGCWAQFFVARYAQWDFPITLLDGVNILILVGLAQTVLVRTRGIFRNLGSSSE